MRETFRSAAALKRTAKSVVAEEKLFDDRRKIRHGSIVTANAFKMNLQDKCIRAETRLVDTSQKHPVVQSLHPCLSTRTKSKRRSKLGHTFMQLS